MGLDTLKVPVQLFAENRQKITELDKMLEESGEKASALRVDCNTLLDAIDNAELADDDITSKREEI